MTVNRMVAARQGPKGLLVLILVSMGLLMPTSGASASQDGSGPFGPNNGGAQSFRVTGLNGISAYFTVPTDRMDSPAYCPSLTSYLVVPSQCRNVSAGEGGNVRPMQIVATTATGAQAGDFVAIGVATGCVEDGGAKCTGWGGNGQGYKRIYADSAYYGSYSLTYYGIVSMGSTHQIMLQRQYVNSVPRWVTFVDGAQTSSIGPADGSFTTGKGIFGVESASRTDLNMDFGWSQLKYKKPNGTFSGNQPNSALIETNPRGSCGLIQTSSGLQGQGRC